MNRKRTAKCTLVILLAICMVFSAGTGVFAANAQNFTDVGTGHWAYSYVNDVVQKGLFTGTSSTTFSPDENMTRGMFIFVLSKMSNVTGINNVAGRFQDVPAGMYYTGAVNWGVTNGIVSGITDTTFGPDEPITREQMAVMMVNYAKFTGINMNSNAVRVAFTDEAQINSYALDAVTKCQKKDLISGLGDGSFGPQMTATRAQVAVIASKLNALKVGVYTVYFDLVENGATNEPAPQVVTFGDVLVQPDDPSYSGHTFEGWYTQKEGGSKWDFTDSVVEEMTLFARWKEVEDTNPTISLAGKKSGSTISEKIDFEDYDIAKLDSGTSEITLNDLELKDLASLKVAMDAGDYEKDVIVEVSIAPKDAELILFHENGKTYRDIVSYKFLGDKEGFSIKDKEVPEKLYILASKEGTYEITLKVTDTSGKTLRTAEFKLELSAKETKKA